MQIADNEVNKQSLHRILMSCQCNCQIANVIRNRTKIGGPNKTKIEEDLQGKWPRNIKIQVLTAPDQKANLSDIFIGNFRWILVIGCSTLNIAAQIEF